jgi:uncharacterized spore protein YtfJ
MTTTIESQPVPAQSDEFAGIEPLERLFAAAQPGAVFSEPVSAGAYTVITASEVSLGGGFGFGGGYGPTSHADGSASETAVAGGKGGGGAGGSTGRPIAAIIIGPDGVKVQPIVDVTKFLLTMIGTMRFMAGVARRRARAQKR